MYSLYRELLALREQHAALHDGRLDLVPGAPKGTVAWLRSDGTERVLVAANLSDSPRAVPLGDDGTLLLATAKGVRVDSDRIGAPVVHLPANTAAIVALG